jgi:hypothetical protein
MKKPQHIPETDAEWRQLEESKEKVNWFHRILWAMLVIAALLRTFWPARS